jgi:GNAT superfamily N-acetyltransferase
MHPLLDEDVLMAIHSGTHTDLGLKAEAFLVLQLGHSVQVQVAVRDAQGRKVGEIKTRFTLADGEMEARYQLVEIDEIVRGHGFGRSYFNDLEREIRERGGDVITLHTWRTGNYVFAQLDFDFDVAGSTDADVLAARQRYTRDLVVEARQAGRITAAEAEQLEPVLFDDVEPRPRALSRPLELAQLERDLGWRILSGHQWNGIKWLV